MSIQAPLDDISPDEIEQLKTWSENILRTKSNSGEPLLDQSRHDLKVDFRQARQ
jgi:hypothetical protein